MQLYELLLIALGLSMDAFAVSVCKGFSARHPRWGQCLLCGLWFGGFQALMPLLGWLMGVRFQTAIASIDHWIAFFLLGIIGLNMVRSGFSNEDDGMDNSFGFGAMLPLAVATSIDALAVGVTFAFLQVKILPAVILIGVTTLVPSSLGVKMGAVLGDKFGRRAELVGGVVLILMGGKILLEHIFFS